MLILLVAVHLLSAREGPAWRSPLVLGDHLFDVAFAGITLLYALVIGRKIAAPLIVRENDSLAESLAALGLGLGILSQAILVVGFVRLYYGIAFLAAFALLTWWLKDELRDTLEQLRAALARWVRAGMPSAPALGQRLALLVLLPILASIFVRALIPTGGAVTDWDALAYHQAAPRIYIALHRYVPLPDIPLANAPAGEQMLLIPGLLAGTTGQEKVLDLAFALLLGLAVYTVGRRHFGTSAGWLGALLFFNTIWVLPIIPTALVDFSSAFLLVLGAGDLLTWAERRTGKRGDDALLSRVALPFGAALDRSERLLLRAGLLVGLAAATKLVYLPALPALCGVTAVTALSARQRRLTARAVLALRWSLIAGAGALGALAVWLVKSIYFFGSALYPVDVQTASNGAAVASPRGATGGGANPLVLAEHAWRFVGAIGELGWHFTSPYCVVLLVAPLLLRYPAGRIGLLFLASASILWMAYDVLFEPPRYWLGLVAMCAILTAGTIQASGARLMVANRPVRAVAVLASCILSAYWLATVPFAHASAGWFVAILVIQLAASLLAFGSAYRRRIRYDALEVSLVCFLGLNSVFSLFLELRQLDRVRALAVIAGQVSQAEYLSAVQRPYAPEMYVNEHLPRGSAVVLLGVTRSAYLDRPYLADWYGVRRTRLLGTPDERAAELRLWCRASVRFAIFDRGKEDPDGAQVQPRSAFVWLRTPGLEARVLYSARGVDVLAVRPCGIEGA